MIGTVFAVMALLAVGVIITAKAGIIGLVLMFLAFVAWGGSAATA